MNLQILFLDEPTAGVDVELRKDMWKVVEIFKRNRRYNNFNNTLY